MTWPDVVNGAFEALAAGFAALSVRRLWIDKKVRGVSPIAIGFFTAWGIWNLFYYPHLGQMVSFLGGLGVVTVNGAYLTMMARYVLAERRTRNSVRFAVETTAGKDPDHGNDEA